MSLSCILFAPPLLVLHLLILPQLKLLNGLVLAWVVSIAGPFEAIWEGLLDVAVSVVACICSIFHATIDECCPEWNPATMNIDRRIFDYAATILYLVLFYLSYKRWRLFCIISHEYVRYLLAVIAFHAAHANVPLIVRVLSLSGYLVRIVTKFIEWTGAKSTDPRHPPQQEAPNRRDSEARDVVHYSACLTAIHYVSSVLGWICCPITWMWTGAKSTDLRRPPPREAPLPVEHTNPLAEEQNAVSPLSLGSTHPLPSSPRPRAHSSPLEETDEMVHEPALRNRKRRPEHSPPRRIDYLRYTVHQPGAGSDPPSDFEEVESPGADDEGVPSSSG